jgi:hypothetical protein
MNLKFWSHQNGFRSPTEQQLVRWETDGGNYRECEDAVLCDGRLYSCQAELMRARVQAKMKKIASYIKDRFDSRIDFRRQASNLYSNL